MGTRADNALGQIGRGTVVDPTIATLASAATIAPTDIVTRITGNTTIDTITSPDAYFNGPLYLYNTDSSVGTISTNGNVALGVTLTRYKLFGFVFDPSTSKWYPSSAS